MAEFSPQVGIEGVSGLRQSVSGPVASAPQLEVSADRARTCYANFARVTGTPEELIIDVGLNAQPFGDSTQPVQMEQRVVLGFATAKRLMGALQLLIQRHEQTFGVVNLDVQARLRSAAPKTQ